MVEGQGEDDLAISQVMPAMKKGGGSLATPAAPSSHKLIVCEVALTSSPRARVGRMIFTKEEKGKG